MLPDGVTPAPAASLGFEGHVYANAVSRDGSRVIWSDVAEGTGVAHLYMNDTANGQTIQLDAAQGVPEPLGRGSAQFQVSSADGSRVFFTDTQQLTAESSAEAQHSKADLYECEITEAAGRLACKLKDLTVVSEGEAAAVQGLLLGAGEEGASVYLVAQGVLAENENGGGERAEPGRENLYALHETGGSWSTVFIATLSGEDSPEWQGNGQGESAFLTARVSPSGRYLAFMSSASLTGYDNLDLNSGKPDEEVYLYDSASASLRCVSCNPTGGRPVGVFDTEEAGEGRGLLVDRRKVWAGHWLAASIPGWTSQSLESALFQPRYLSDTGRLFFNGADALVGHLSATTREENVGEARLKVGVENVYEYEPAGAGSCESPSGGCVALLSAGTSDRESAFMEATPSGDDVFFLTAAQLSPQDTDTAFDIYDARVCSSSSPCLTPPPSAPGACETSESCNPAPAALQAPLAPSGSATAAGPGNVVAQTTPAAHGVEARKTAKPLTRAQKLARALTSCRKRHPGKKRRARREVCERHARKAFAPAKHKTSGSKKAGKHAAGRRG